MKKIILWVLTSFTLIFILLLTIRPRPEQLQRYLVHPAPKAQGNHLTVQFLGNTNLLFSDGKTSILTDGFFTRPNSVKVLFGKVSPNRETIINSLKRASIGHLDAVIPVHSHFDHAMDAAMVADICGAQLIGSSSTANIGKGYGLSEDQLQVPELGSMIQVGKFEITFIQSNHWQYPDPKERERLLNCAIEDPLKTPASIYAYKEGISYTILIKHDSTRIAIQGSAGFKKNSIKDFDADILFLAVAGLDVMDEAYNNNYQNLLIAPLKPEVLVPIHWDDFTVSLSEKPLATPNVLFNLKFGSDLSKAFKELEKRNPERTIKVLNSFSPYSIHDLKEPN